MFIKPGFPLPPKCMQENETKAVPNEQTMYINIISHCPAKGGAL